MSGDDQTRDEIEEIVNDEKVHEAAIETIIEEGVKPVKAKSKAKAKARPKTKITKDPVEPIKEEEPEPVVVVEEKTENGKLKELVNCTDCGLNMTQHTLTYIHKKEDAVKEHVKKQLKKKLKLKLKRKSHLDYRSRSQQKQ